MGTAPDVEYAELATPQSVRALLHDTKTTGERAYAIDNLYLISSHGDGSQTVVTFDVHGSPTRKFTPAATTIPGQRDGAAAPPVEVGEQRYVPQTQTEVRELLAALAGLQGKTVSQYVQEQHA